MAVTIVMLIALILMIGIWIWLFRDGEGTVRTGRLAGKLRDTIPGPHIRVKVAPPAGEESAPADAAADTTTRRSSKDHLQS